MSKVVPTEMDNFLPLISTTDTKMRLSVGAKLLLFVLNPSNSIVCSDIGLLIDHLINWLQSSNHKIVQNALDVLGELINRMRYDFQPYLTSLLPHLVDKLEDNKEIIREKTSCLFLKLVDCEVIGLQNLFDKISVSCFNHKNSNVREQIMYLLCTVLDNYGTSTITISKFVPNIVKLLSDSNASVRSTAFDTLCKIYKHVGERLRVDLLKKNLIPSNKLQPLMNKFDEIKSSDDGLTNAFQSLKLCNDEVDLRDNRIDGNSLKRPNSRPPVTPASLSLACSAKKKIMSASVSASKMNMNSQSGGVDEESFIDSFEKVPAVQIYSGKDVHECLKKYYEILNKENEDWCKRVDCLKKIRSLIVAGALNYDEFYDYLNMLLPSFDSSIKDLRSMVVREACVTIAYLSKCLEMKFDHFAESVLIHLINLIQNSKKVIASSGLVCIRFIIQYTQAPRLIPVITNNINSKSKDIRRACCEFVDLILRTWNVHSFERYAPVIQEAIKKGITDADSDTRLHSRKAYVIFSQHFPDLAESLKNSLDFTYRKLLFGGSNGGSNSSLSKCQINDIGKSSIPRTLYQPVSVRSNSAIDLQAVKRAKTRAQYAAMARQKFGGGTPSRTTVKNIVATPSIGVDQRSGRTKSRISVSQPTSRSGSPSSRFSSYSHYLGSSGGGISRSRKSSIGNDTSRETSPNRSFGLKSRLSTQPVRKPVTTQKILQQSREAETELADALGNVSDLSSPYLLRPLTRVSHNRIFEDHSDESETSSMCSEHSFDSYRRPSDSMSWNGSQHRLFRDTGDMPLKNIGEIIINCESSHWNERKRGLISLQYYIQDGNKLELFDLRKIMDIFLKIFNDPHIKVFSLFLDTLNELILSHNGDLCFCLHLLLTRLFNKLGTDLLNSVHSKIMKTLENVFAVFPHDLQIQSVFRFLVDPTQTPNTRVKVTALNYIIKLATVVDPCAAFNSNNNMNKDYATLALTKMINWTMVDNIKSSPELRKVAQETISALFNLNPSQVTRRFASMASDYQEIAANICKRKCSPKVTNTDVTNSIKPESNLEQSPQLLDCSIDVNLSCGSDFIKMVPGRSSSISLTNNTHTDNGYKSFCKRLVNELNNHALYDSIDSGKSAQKSNADIGQCDDSLISDNVASYSSDTPLSSGDGDAETQINYKDVCKNQQLNGNALQICIDELSQVKDNQHAKKDLLTKLILLVRDSSSEIIITHFKSLLGRIVSLMSSSEPSFIKELVLNLLQMVVKRKTVTFLLKQFSDLVITKVIALCSDSSKDVVKAAENCAIVLSTHLPAESVVRITVPLITSEAAPVKLVAIKMLTRLIECSDDTVTLANIDQIMPVLLIAYDDIESAVRKEAVYCMVALYKQSNEMKVCLEPYIAKLQGAKLKLLQLYIDKAEQSSSMPTSPKNS